jgi:hypothetical protein
MQQRVPLLIVTGALAFGSIGYFLFIFDDGTMPTHNSPQHPLNLPRRPTGAGANSAASSAGLPPSMSPPVPIATTPAPVDTGPPE